MSLSHNRWIHIGVIYSWDYPGGPHTARYYINGRRVPHRLWAFVANRMRPR